MDSTWLLTGFELSEMDHVCEVSIHPTSRIWTQFDTPEDDSPSIDDFPPTAPIDVDQFDTPDDTPMDDDFLMDDAFMVGAHIVYLDEAPIEGMDNDDPVRFDAPMDEETIRTQTKNNFSVDRFRFTHTRQLFLVSFFKLLLEK